MPWFFKGLYTVAEPAARERLDADELVRGQYRHIRPGDAPRARLPRAGLLLVHGLGPPGSEYDDDRSTPWDAFWPAWPTDRLARYRRWLRVLEQWHRPPAQLIAWMAEFHLATRAPIGLYQCRMDGGDIDSESAVAVDGRVGVTVRQHTGRRPFRRWVDGRPEPADSDPLRTLLRAVGAVPTGWFFEPHEWRDLPLIAPPTTVLDRSSLHRAVARGDLTTVGRLLARGAGTGDYPYEPLPDLAARHGHEAVLARLLAAGAAVRTGAGNTLGRAATPGCARLLTERGALLHDHPSPLASVARRGFTDTARWLVEQGAAVDFGADDGALWLSAAEGGVSFLVERGIAEGVDVDRHQPGEFADRPAVELAAGGGHRAVVDLLVAAGARPTPGTLVAAAEGGHTDLVRDLLARGLDPDSRRHDTTALHEAARRGHLDTVRLLVASGADPAALSHGELPLGVACLGAHPEVVGHLLSVRPDLVDGPGTYPPLWSAVAGGNTDVVELLLRHGADVRATNRWGESVVDFARSRGVPLDGARTGSAGGAASDADGVRPGGDDREEQG